ncbi:MAG: M20/M25/M40 family metallo-hydrolase, partial [Gemmatimonadetes bacterium]|nr:M20 family metallopeptidase [Gemmatimonadota bacterium]NIQ52892.1 M20 family metallopeptidase [Gemmatimonadota bacterium]NIU73023.1 M20/M25/M40 family metallo-hydrolase [Gammaproteobacteria bacterium]NIX43366.1 M20/M25/M40 family metallo-hydrolase [Gemmatimonadota bacterium]
FEARLVDMAAVDRGPHLVAERWEGERGRSVLLIGHLDTVFEEDEAFQTFVREGDTARGPGVSDMKGGDVVVIYALKALQAMGALDGTR